MTEKAILAIEEALLANLFTQRALVGLLIKKGIIQREDLEKEILKADAESTGAGKTSKHFYLEKRRDRQRRQEHKKIKRERRTGLDRRGAF